MPQLRVQIWTEFLNRVAAPIAHKRFESPATFEA